MKGIPAGRCMLKMTRPTVVSMMSFSGFLGGQARTSWESSM